MIAEDQYRLIVLSQRIIKRKEKNNTDYFPGPISHNAKLMIQSWINTQFENELLNIIVEI